MEDLSIEKLIYLRNNLDSSKLGNYDPRFNELIPFLETNLESLEKIRIKDLTSGNFPAGHFQLIDFTKFICISILDFLIPFQSYFNAATKWGKGYFLRQLSLIIYEFIDDIHPTLNETLRKNSELDKVDADFKTKLNDLAKKLAFIKQLKYDDHLKAIRHQTVAHKEADVDVLYNTIKTLDEKLIVACSLFLLHWIIELSILLKDIPPKLEALRPK